MILKANQALSTTPVVTTPQSIEGWAQVVLEIVPGADLVGNLEIVVELAHEDGAFFAIPMEDPASGTTVSGDFQLPVKRLKYTVALATGAIALPVICPGYSSLRCQVTAGTSGSAVIWMHKTRLSAP